MACVASISSIQNCNTDQTAVLTQMLVSENTVNSYVERQGSQEQEIVMQTAFSNFINLLV